MIHVIDCGMGNVAAFLDVYRRLGIPARRATTPADIAAAERLVLPGVGTFDWAMQRLRASGLLPALEDAVRQRGVPVLGVCIGMQIMAESSEEGQGGGLGWIAGQVRRLPAHDRLPLPHMGWNEATPASGHGGLFAGLQPAARFYFLHSYHFVPAKENACIATTDYGITFACAVRQDNICGVQFHPEKSHAAGMRLLKNFAEL